MMARLGQDMCFLLPSPLSLTGARVYGLCENGVRIDVKFVERPRPNTNFTPIQLRKIGKPENTISEFHF